MCERKTYLVWFSSPHKSLFYPVKYEQNDVYMDLTLQLTISGNKNKNTS